MAIKSIVKLVASCAILGLAWFMLAPTALGGHDDYVITDGTSMLPTITGGGLIVTRAQPSYHVGEVVAYRDKQLENNLVLHRITAIDNGRYSFKGDNNSYPDTWHPTKAAIVGRKWIYWSLGGRLLQNLRTPWVGALILGFFGMWAFADIGSNEKPSRGDRPRKAT